MPPPRLRCSLSAVPKDVQTQSYTYKHPGAQILTEISHPRSLLTAFGRAAIRLPAFRQGCDPRVLQPR